MYRIFVFALVLTLLLCLASAETHAQVEYGTSAAAGVDIAAVPDGPYSEENLGGTPASARADLVDAVAESLVGMSNVSCLTEITDIADSNAYTYNTFFWDTFTATSASLLSGTPTTVTFSVELGAELSASSNDPTVMEADVVSIMVVDIYSVNLTSGLPEDVQDLFVGSAVLDAAAGLRLEDDLVDSDFDVSAGAAGYEASLSAFAIPIAIDTLVGSSFSLKLSMETLSSVAPGLSDGSATADLRDGLRIVEIQTADEVDLARASGVTEPPPVAALSADVAGGGTPLQVSFTDESTGTITSWLWNFGDGNTSTEQNPSHTYSSMGDYTVTLTVSGPAGSDIEALLVHVDETSPGVGRYKAVVDGIKVVYTKGGCSAERNEVDGTLAIDIWEDNGTLTVICGEEASTYWGSQCDVYIHAPDISIKNINLKGRPETQLHVCGQVGYVKNFKLKYGFVGNTASYNPDFGLGSDAQDPAKKILIKWGATAAPLLGVEYTDLRSVPALDETGNVELGAIELKQKPFAALFDEADADIDEEVDPEERAFAAAAVLAETKAQYAVEIGDVKVRYTQPGCRAYIDPSNGTLNIEISDSDGILTVKCGAEAYAEWGDFCDIYIDAPEASIKTMILKGTPETQLHVCGEVGHVENFKLKYGCVGDTEHYGPAFGLYNTWLGLPNKIMILRGWATAPVLGVSE